MRQKVLISIVFSICLISVNAQSWLWGRQGKCSKNPKGGAEGFSALADKYGNAIFSCNSSIDTTIFSQDTIESKYGGFCLVKYNSNGKLLWINNASNSSSTSGANSSGGGWPQLATDNSSNIYATGVFIDTALFGTVLLKGVGMENAFIVKYNSNGNVEWAKQSIHPSNSSYGLGFSVATDKQNNVFICGSFLDTCMFSPFVLTSKRQGQAFLVKYDSSGNILWARQSTGNNNMGGNGALGVGTDSKGNSYLTGLFTDTVVFGSQMLVSPSRDMFVIKYDPLGNVIWAKKSKEAISGQIYGSNGIAVDKDGNSYVIGNFNDTLDLGKYQLIPYKTGAPYGDIFMAKFDSAGNVIWAEQGMLMDNNYWQPYSITLDNVGHFIISAIDGKYPIKVSFGSDTLNVTYPTSSADAAFIAQFDTAGKYLCGSGVTTGGDDQNGVATDPSGNYIYFAGDAADTITFGADKIGVHGAEWPFIARWMSCIPELGYQEEQKSKFDFEVFPNPTSDMLNVRFLSKPNLSVEAVIYDLTGRKVIEKVISLDGMHTQNFMLDVSRLFQGIYFLNLKSGKCQWTTKFSVIR